MDISKIYGQYVFNDKAMKKYLPKETYIAFKKMRDEGKELPDGNMAKIIAKAMCEWAVDLGATHYTHWFQPLTNATAEKHDSFLSFDSKNNIILKLSGKELVKGESDASSFPSGGLRATFEARGYTVWDTSSPAFIRKDETGTTLCIPTAFYSYTGEALDKKSTLIRSMDAVNKASLSVLKIFKNKTAKKVTAMLGPEQEYFLIDRDMYLQRKDLIYTGRTLFGALPPKGQEMDDHYYGAIRSNIGAFMDEVNTELWKLGVPAKTHHNEVAPAQHELAVLYDEANVSCDHNQIVMEMLKKIASKYNLVCLLHEKPFDNLNGSGKHNNWSLVTDEGENLLNPGVHPETNLQFLLVMSLIVKAVDEYAEVLRSSASNVGNDRRLGGSEAPPTIISVFLGEQLSFIFDSIENDYEKYFKEQYLSKNNSSNRNIKSNKSSKNQAKSSNIKSVNDKMSVIKTGAIAIPDLYKDVSDRNRTSPFAFTGNKFEFRMVGSSDSCAMPVATINAMTSIVFNEFSEAFANKKFTKQNDFDLEVLKYIADIWKSHKKVVFNGNGYSKDWAREAESRGLKVVNDMVSAIKVLKTKKAHELYVSTGVMTESELVSRVEVEFENYLKTIRIEVKTMIDIVKKEILPAVLLYKNQIAETIISTRDVYKNDENKATDFSFVENQIFNNLNENIKNLYADLKELEYNYSKCEEIDDMENKALEFRKILVPCMDKLRSSVDALEMLVDREYWPMPSYGDLIFEVSPI